MGQILSSSPNLGGRAEQQLTTFCDAAEKERTRKTRMAGKQGQMFEASWERIDSARNPDLYETKDGVTFLRGNQQQEENTSVIQSLTEEELRNVEKAAEKMNDRED